MLRADRCESCIGLVGSPSFDDTGPSHPAEPPSEWRDWKLSVSLWPLLALQKLAHEVDRERSPVATGKLERIMVERVSES